VNGIEIIFGESEYSKLCSGFYMQEQTTTPGVEGSIDS